MGTKNSSWEGRRWEKTSPRCSRSLAWERTLRLNRTVRHMRIKGSRLGQQGLRWWGHNLLPPPIHIHNSVGKSPSKVSLEALLSEDPDSVQSNHSCQGTFNFKGSNTFSSLVCRFSRTLCFLAVPGKQERAELHTVLRTEIMEKGTCLDSLPRLSSVTLYLKDYPFCWNWWNFILFNGWVIILLKIYKQAFLQIKYPCFTQDLGPLHPSSFRPQSPGPSLWRLWHTPRLGSAKECKQEEGFKDMLLLTPIQPGVFSMGREQSEAGSL